MKNIAFLTDTQNDLISYALNHGTPILIDGDRAQPTGKSWLCQHLKSLGANVRECWELEEGNKALTETLNQAYILICLNKALPQEAIST